MSKDFKIVIPVRYDSTRFPGKAMVDIGGMPMIQHVFECAQKTEASEVIIATDTPRIGMAAEKFGAKVCMTDSEHQSGTDRIAEVVDKMAWDDDIVVVNLQGDEPLMPAATINQVASNLLNNTDADCATLYANIDNQEDIEDPNVVKVVNDKNGMALYFSRSAIPHRRDMEDGADPVIFKRHIGLYAYRAGTLRAYKNLEECRLESTEKLEQLRILYNGMKIHIDEAIELPGHGVDTPEDLEKVKAQIAESEANL